LIIRPDPSLHIPPQLITMPIIIAPRNQHRDRLLTKLRVQRQRIAVHLPPQHVLTMIGRRETRLILIPAAKLRVNHIHERVLSQPSPVSPARKTFVEPAPLTPRVVKTPDLVHNLASEIQHRTAGQVKHTMLVIPPNLPDRPMIRCSLKLELKMLRRRHRIGNPPVPVSGVTIIVKQEEVLDTSLVQKLDALVLRDRSPTVHVEPVKNPTLRHRYRLSGPIIDHDLDGPLGELTFHLPNGPLKHRRAIECRDRNTDWGNLTRLREPRRRKRRLREIPDSVNYNILELDILAAGQLIPLAITSPIPRRILPPRLVRALNLWIAAVTHPRNRSSRSNQRETAADTQQRPLVRQNLKQTRRYIPANRVAVVSIRRLREAIRVTNHPHNHRALDQHQKVFTNHPVLDLLIQVRDTGTNNQLRIIKQNTNLFPLVIGKLFTKPSLDVLRSRVSHYSSPSAALLRGRP